MEERERLEEEEATTGCVGEGRRWCRLFALPELRSMVRWAGDPTDSAMPLGSGFQEQGARAGALTDLGDQGDGAREVADGARREPRQAGGDGIRGARGAGGQRWWIRGGAPRGAGRHRR